MQRLHCHPGGEANNDGPSCGQHYSPGVDGTFVRKTLEKLLLQVYLMSKILPI